jgi:hypothetical protein
MKYLLIILFTGLAITSFAQQQIKLEEVRNHIGDSVKLMAKIYGGKYFETGNNTLTLLDIWCPAGVFTAKTFDPNILTVRPRPGGVLPTDKS